MRKISLTVIFILILTTSLVKNSTKEIEDQIFTVNENIRSLKTEFGNVMLEYNYLSSPEKLIQLQSKYFENDLIKVDIINKKKSDRNSERDKYIEKYSNKMIFQITKNLDNFYYNVVIANIHDIYNNFINFSKDSNVSYKILIQNYKKRFSASANIQADSLFEVYWLQCCILFYIIW